MKSIKVYPQGQIPGAWIARHGKTAVMICLPVLAVQLGMRPFPSQIKEAITANSSPGDEPVTDSTKIIFTK